MVKNILIFIIFICLSVTTLIWVLLEKSLLPRRSTREFWRLTPLPWRKKVEGYLYAARTSWYLKPLTVPVIKSLVISRETADTYHGKLLTQREATRLISVKKPVIRNDLEHIIPYQTVRSLILNDPLPSLAVMNCPCRSLKPDSCKPLDVCIIMGEPFVSFVLDHQTHARRITVEEALRILEEEERRGHIHTAWFKGVMHNRFYAICNCCSCCCLGMESFFRGIPRISHSGHKPVLSESLCLHCTACGLICPFHAVEFSPGNLPEFRPNLCMGCGLCVSHCPNRALVLVPAPERGIPLDIDRLIQNHEI